MCAIYRNITKLLYPKWKLNEKKKKKKEEKKRSEEKKVLPGYSGPTVHRAKALPLGHVEHTRH